MKNRYAYSIFFLLGALVFVMIFLSYNYIATPERATLDEEISDVDDTTYSLHQENIKDTWLGQFQKDLNQKSYFYAVSEMQLRLN